MQIIHSTRPLKLIAPCLLVTLLSLWLLPVLCNAADWSEAIVRPDKETVKTWLKGEPIILEKRKWLPDKKELLDDRKIVELKAEGGKLIVNPPGVGNDANSVYTFGYLKLPGQTNRYTASITYGWEAGITGIKRKKTGVVITGP